MSKLVRAAIEAVTTIVVTLGIIVGAFAAMFGLDQLMALAGAYYAVWALIILGSHLGLAHKRRHLRLSIGVGAGVAVMGVHLAMFLLGNIPVELNLIPVILHDFGLALIGMIVLNIVHLVIFRRRRGAKERTAASVSDVPAPSVADRIDDLPGPGESQLPAATA